MKKRIIAILMLFVLLLGNSNIPVEAASLKLRYNGKNVTYTGKQIKIKINGTNKSISKSPGIMMGSGGYAMLPYYETFVTSSIKMNKTYYKSTKKLTLTYNGDTLIMTVNKKKATFNGKSVTLPVAPVSVKYRSSGVTRILVPSRKVAELFGLEYSWNSSTKTVAISSNNSNGDSNSVSSSTATTGSASYYRNGKRYTLKKRFVSYNGTEINLSSTPACLIDSYNYVPYYYAFVKNGPKIQRKYSSSKKQVTLTSTINGKTNKLVMKVNSKKATLNGKSVTLPRAPLEISHSKNGKTMIYVPAKIVGTLLGFEYSYNSSTKMINYVPGLSIKMNGSYSVYTRTQVSIMANKTAVATTIPGILENNTTLIPGKAVSNSAYGLGITYSYSSNKATFKRGNTTVIMTKNSKIAKVNGVSKTMSVPMRMIMLSSNGSTYVMVPGEFLATELGLSYQYVNGVSYITIPAATTTSTSAPTTTPSNPGTTKPFSATITLSKPSGIGNGMMSCVDDYHNKRLVVSIPGDYRTYYNTNKPVLPSGVSYSVKYVSSNNTTQIIFSTAVINGFRVQEDNNHLYIMNGTPKEMFNNVIVLDAGHGGSDVGAVGNGYYEKDFTLSIVQAAKQHFDTNSDYKVYYTRLDDTYPSLSDRYQLANAVGADIFISVHINSASSSSATGTETLYNPDRNKVSAAGLSCYQLAYITQKHVKAATGLTDRGLKQRCSRLGNGLAVLNWNNGPATLTEIGFISNPTEARLMASNLNNYGLAVYNAVVSASTSYPTNR